MYTYIQWTRDYWKNREPGFLAVAWFGSSPTPLTHLSAIIKLFLFLSLSTVCVAGRAYWRERLGEGGWRVAESYDHEKILVFNKSFNTLWIVGGSQKFFPVKLEITGTLFLKKIKFSSFIWKFRMEQLQCYIWLTASSYMVKYLRISSYIRKPFLKYDFATAPFGISVYTRKIFFSFYQCSPQIWCWCEIWRIENMMRIFACSLGLEVEELLAARGRQPRLLRTE